LRFRIPLRREKHYVRCERSEVGESDLISSKGVFSERREKGKNTQEIRTVARKGTPAGTHS